MKIIITGATGSLGASLTRWFSHKGHDVFAVGRVNNPPAGLRACSTYIQADITSPYKLPVADVCIHTAAIADDKAKLAILHKVNVEGTKNTARAAKDCQTFIHVSSSSVYTSSVAPLTEGMAGKNSVEKLSNYGASKLLAEKKLKEVCVNDTCFILRPRGIYGPGDKVLLPRLLKLVRGGKMLRPGKMEVKLSMTHFNNFNVVVEKCIHSRERGEHIYNVADDEIYVLHDVVRKFLFEIYLQELPERRLPLWLLRLLGALKFPNVTPLFVNTVTKDHVLDISKIKEEINYRAVMSLDAALPEIGEWVKKIGGTEILKKANPRLAWEGCE